MSDARGVKVDVTWSVEFQDEAEKEPSTTQWVPQQVYDEGITDPVLVADWLTDQTDWLVEDWILAKAKVCKCDGRKCETWSES